MIIIKNLLTEEQRKNLIKKSQPILVSSPKYPSRQTHPEMHLFPGFVPISNIFLEAIEKEVGRELRITKCWITYVTGKKEESKWHTHLNCDLTAVYYIKTLRFLNSGTEFEKKGLVRVSQNDMLIFDPKLVHRPPRYPFQFKRYTLTLELSHKYP